MDKRAKEELFEILTSLTQNPLLIEEAERSIVDIFHRYRLRAIRDSILRRQIEAELRKGEVIMRRIED